MANHPGTAALRVETDDAQPCCQDLRELLDAQRAAFRSAPPDYARRLDALRALESAIRSHQGEIVEAADADFGGRAAEETLALEVFPLLNELRYARRHLKGWMAPRRAAVQWPFWPSRAGIIYQPLGVVGVLSPWNYPFFLGLSPLAGILAAGNHAILKPSELTPASGEVIRTIVAEALPPSYVTVIIGGADTAADLARLPLDHLLFTGSTRVGILVARAASERLVPVTLELGGKSPAIVHDSYSMEKAAARILAGKLYNAGQTCVAPDYVLVPDGRAAEFVAAARSAIARMFPTLAGNPDYTRIINTHHYARLAALVDDARARGAQVDTVSPGPERGDASNRVFPPMLLTRVRDDMAIMREEIFGPILPVVEYRSLEDAIAYVGARPHPLAMYYFDGDRSRADDVLSRVVSGGAVVNDCLFHVGQPALPFGGVGASGTGRYHGVHGFERFSNQKGVLRQGRWSPLAWLRPPYNARKRALIDLLLR